LKVRLAWLDLFGAKLDPIATLRAGALLRCRILLNELYFDAHVPREESFAGCCGFFRSFTKLATTVTLWMQSLA
jgi:hypothetical protein